MYLLMNQMLKYFKFKLKIGTESNALDVFKLLPCFRTQLLNNLMKEKKCYLRIYIRKKKVHKRFSF